MVGRYPPVCDRITNAGSPNINLDSGGPPVVGLVGRQTGDIASPPCGGFAFV